ncbi:helix-turn-helix transcriptional regulator [Rhodopseudomonas pseudopalustris]|uniref:helix-turn-helix transcriptional regulator n=1 Tax=Rhodopseudomonas pseudopalustris TaxID=1513892 RepID=UPI001FCE1F1A|nr:LuxR family transcriptional regulator [Rhodopseudomonas pseudopalustris]
MFLAFERLDQARTDKETREVLADALGAFGFEYFIAGSRRIDPHDFDRMLLLDGWPSRWRKQYRGDNLLQKDPIARHARRSLDPFLWKDVPVQTADELRVMDLAAADYGFVSGFTVPIYGTTGYQATFSATGRDIDASRDALKAAELLALYAYRRTIRIRSESREFVLTRREREVMTWAAAGKSAWDTGEILQISEQTVKCHISSVLAKLKVCSKAQAIVESMRRGEIEP